MSTNPLPPPPPPHTPIGTNYTQAGWPTGVATGIKVLSILTSVAWGLFVLAIINRIVVLNDIKTGNWSEDLSSRADDADGFASGTAGLALLLSVATIILMMIWLFRTTKMIRARGFTTRFGPGWAIGGFFIPLAQIVIPFLMFVDCKKAITFWNGSGTDNRYAILGWWWWLQTGSLLVGRALSSEDTTDIDSLINQEYIRLAMGAGLLVGAVFGALVFDRFRADFGKIVTS